jgi:hypothetical protein
MGTRGYFGFRYNKKYYMVYNPYDSYYSHLGIKLLNEVRNMVKNNQFELWISLFLNLYIVNNLDIFYQPIIPENIFLSNVTSNKFIILDNTNIKDIKKIMNESRIKQSFLEILNSGYILIEQKCLNKINYSYLDGEFFYILDFDKKRFIVKESGYRRQKYKLFNGEINKVYFEDSNGEESSDEDK